MATHCWDKMCIGSQMDANAVRPPTIIRKNDTHQITPQLIISLSFFIGKHLTVLLAGLALKTHGSLVNGFTPLRAGRASFFFNFMLRRPAILKEPFFLSSPAASSMYPVMMDRTTFGFNSLLAATAAYPPDTVMAPPLFMAFIAGAMVTKKRVDRKSCFSELEPC